MVRETDVSASFPGVTAREYHEQIQGAGPLIDWQKDNHNNDRITVGDWKPANVHPHDPTPVQTRDVQFWQPLNAPKVIQKLARMDVVRVDDVQRLTFFRDTEEMVQGFSPRITVPGFGTFTTITIEFRYRNTVDANGQQALKVSGTIRASGEEAPWALRPIFEAVFISECFRIADSILKTAAPLLQNYVAKRDKGWPTPIIAQWPLDQSPPTANLPAEPDNFPPTNYSTTHSQPALGHSTDASPASAVDLSLPIQSGEGARHTEMREMSPPGAPQCYGEEDDLGCRLDSFLAYYDAVEDFEPGWSEDVATEGVGTQDERNPTKVAIHDERNPKGVVDRSESSESLTGSQGSDADVSASSKPSNMLSRSPSSGFDALEPTARDNRRSLHRLKERWCDLRELAQQKLVERRQRLWRSVNSARSARRTAQLQSKGDL